MVCITKKKKEKRLNKTKNVYYRSEFWEDPREDRQPIRSRFFERKGIVSSGSERRIYEIKIKSNWSKKTRNMWKKKREKVRREEKKKKRKRARKSKQNSRPLAYVWMQNRWWKRRCSRSSPNERDNVTPCIPDMTPIYPKRDRRRILLSKIRR